MTNVATPPVDTTDSSEPTPSYPVLLPGILGYLVAAGVLGGLALFALQWSGDQWAAAERLRPAKEAAADATESYYGTQMVSLANSVGTYSVLQFPTEVDDPTAYYQTRLPSGDVRLCQYDLADAAARHQGESIPNVYCDLPGEASYSDWSNEWNGGEWTALEPVR